MEYINVHAAVSKAYQSLNAPPRPPQPIPGGNTIPAHASGIAGGMIALIIVLVLLELGLFVWGIYALYRFWKLLPTVAAVVSLVLLVFGFSPFSLIVTYAAKRA